MTRISMQLQMMKRRLSDDELQKCQGIITEEIDRRLADETITTATKTDTPQQ